jgi:hypothetical protein
MRSSLVLILVVTLMQNFALAAEGKTEKCSPENLRKLFTVMAKAWGDDANRLIKVTQIFGNKDFSKSKPKDLKQQWVPIENEFNASIDMVKAVIDPILKEHPECDPDHLLTLK